MSQSQQAMDVPQVQQHHFIEVRGAEFSYDADAKGRDIRDAKGRDGRRNGDKRDSRDGRDAEVRNVLNSVDLMLDKGQICCLMGVNGCGKSTLIDCILGVNHITAGSIEINGVPQHQMKPHELARLVSYVPQVHDRAFPYLVKDVVLMGRTAYQSQFSSPDDNDKQIAMQSLRQCGIEHLADRPYTQLSGGEMQMVLLARSLAQNAPFIIMDEPTAHLDFKNELMFMETVTSLVADSGIGVLVATHSPNQSFFFESCGLDVTAALMADGKICKRGKPSEVLNTESLRNIYGIEAKVLSTDLEDGRHLSQIALVSTAKAGEGDGSSQ